MATGLVLKIDSGKLKEFRIQNRLTQVELAAKIGCTSAQVSRWERGVQNIGNIYLSRLSVLFNVQDEELLERVRAF